MMLISNQYRELNAKAHKIQKGYGAKGGRRRQDVLGVANKYGLTTALDYGCGKGDLAKRVPELKWTEYDPAIKAVSKVPEGEYELVFCGDVLEHIEPDKLENVLNHIFSLIGKVGVFVINTKQGGRKLPDGTPAHRIVKPSKWWVDKISEQTKNQFSVRKWFYRENGDVYILIEKS